MGITPPIRAFIAIELPEDIKQNLKVFISTLKRVSNHPKLNGYIRIIFI